MDDGVVCPCYLLPRWQCMKDTLEVAENDHLKRVSAFLVEKWRCWRWSRGWGIRGCGAGIERVDNVDDGYIAFGGCD